MTGQTISHYKIIEKIGEGGMGVVYRAEDTRLKRPVALKFLRTETLGSPEHKARFFREAQAAASFQHPNICTVFEIDEEGDRIFIAMAYAEGKSVRELLRSGPLKQEQAIDVAIQAARGLEAAHSRGVVHRDVKPDNLIVAPENTVTILDFGLAKIAELTVMTETSGFLGTLAYMSPEQARGETVDSRADLWSLGVCLYEMITGEKPFRAGNGAAMINAIMNDFPKPMTSYIPVVPMGLERIVQKALAKDREDRFQDAAEFLADLNHLRRELGAGFARGSEERGGHSVSVAVLPFTNMSPDQDQDYFCDGIAEDILNRLAQLKGLRVASRTSSRAFKDKRLDIREIGRKLGADSVLEGSVRKAGNRIRITAQLVNVTDGYQAWSGQYDRELQDVFAIQDEIAQNIVEALEVELSEKEKQAMGKTSTENVEAYDYYLKGRRYFHKIYGRNYILAMDMYKKAIEIDPDYALAYAGMADSYSFRFMYFDGKKENLENAMKVSQKALDLDPELAEAHASRALAHSLVKDYDSAVQGFETAIRLNPKLFEPYYFYARTLCSMGDLEKGARYFEKASQVDPEDYQAHALLGQTYRGLHQPEKSKLAYRRGLEIIERRLERDPDDTRAVNFAAHCLYELGEADRAVEWAEKALTLDPNEPAAVYNIGCLYMKMGKLDRGFDLLEQTVEFGYAHKEWVENDPDLDGVREHPRYKAILARLEEEQSTDRSA